MTAQEHYNQGKEFRNAGKYDEAHAAFDEAISIDPNYAEPHNGKGNVFNEQRKYDEAHHAFNEAILIDPNDAYSHSGKGDVFRNQQQYGQAHAAYDKAILIDPNEVFPHIGKGNVFHDQRQYDEAHAAYDKAILIDPNDALPHYGKGNVFLDQQQYDEAHTSYDKAILIDPNYALSHYGKGNVFLDQRQYDEAHAAYDKAILIDPNYAAIQNGKGNAFYKQQRYGEAHATYDKAILIDPKVAAPYHAKVHIYLFQLNIHDAIRYLNRWTILEGYVWRQGSSNILPAVPFFTYRIINSYGRIGDSIDIPPWGNNQNYSTALQTAIPFKAFQVYQESKHPFTETEKALFNFYLGDQPEGLRILDQELQAKNIPCMLLCYYALRASDRCITPLAESLLKKINDSAQSVVDNLHGAIQDKGIEEVYYTGLYFRKNNQLAEALRCFGLIASQHPPSRLVKIELLFHLGETRQATQELKAFVQDREAMDQFGLGLYHEAIEPDRPLGDYLQQYAYHDELRATTNFLNEQSKRMYRTIYDGGTLPYFFDLYYFDTPGLEKIYQFFRTTYLRNFYQTYYKEELQPRTRDAFDEATIEDINDAIADIPQSRTREILERLENLPEGENRPRAIAGYFDTNELTPDQALLLNNYFFVNGQTSTYDKWKLDFYLIEKATRSGWQPSKPMEGGTKGAVKKLLENPIGAIGETLAVLASTALSTTFIGSILVAIGTKFSSSFLAELLLQYVKSNKSSFNSYADFEESFEVYIAEQRDDQGTEAFRKRFPLEVLQG